MPPPSPGPVSIPTPDTAPATAPSRQRLKRPPPTSPRWHTQMQMRLPCSTLSPYHRQRQLGRPQRIRVPARPPRPRPVRRLLPPPKASSVTCSITAGAAAFSPAPPPRNLALQHAVELRLLHHPGSAAVHRRMLQRLLRPGVRSAYPSARATCGQPAPMPDASSPPSTTASACRPPELLQPDPRHRLPPTPGRAASRSTRVAAPAACSLANRLRHHGRQAPDGAGVRSIASRVAPARHASPHSSRPPPPVLGGRLARPTRRDRPRPHPPWARPSPAVAHTSVLAAPGARGCRLLAC